MADEIAEIKVEAKDFETLSSTLYEVMEETFPEFVWNGTLVKSTKYKGEEDND